MKASKEPASAASSRREWPGRSLAIQPVDPPMGTNLNLPGVRKTHSWVAPGKVKDAGATPTMEKGMPFRRTDAPRID
jgi:hypothetical protein